jgi:hypothetical protein
MSAQQIGSWIQSHLYQIPADSVVKLKVHGILTAEAMSLFRAQRLRALAPETMNIDATLANYRYDRNQNGLRR